MTRDPSGTLLAISVSLLLGSSAPLLRRGPRNLSTSTRSQSPGQHRGRCLDARDLPSGNHSGARIPPRPYCNFGRPDGSSALSSARWE